MKKLILALALALMCVGCGKQAVFTPHPTESQTVLENPSYNVLAQTQNIEIMFGFPKKYDGGDLEAIVGVGNTSQYSIWADASNFKVYYGYSEPEENDIEVLGYDDLQLGVKTKNFFDRIAIGSIVTVAAVGAAASGHHYETSTFSGSYTGPEWNQGGTFVGSITTHYYDPEENRRNCEAVAQSGTSLITKLKARCDNRYIALAAEYFGGERLEPGRSVIKKVVVKGIKVKDEQQIITAEIKVAGIVRKFLFSLTPKTKKVEEMTPQADAEPISAIEELEGVKNEEGISVYSLPMFK